MCSYLTYDVVKIILEIKYSNWLREKKCVCGYHDFKECEISQCFECTNTYCESQFGWDRWMWECFECEEWFCGNHLLFVSSDYKRRCERCVGHEYEIDGKDRIRSMSQKTYTMYLKSMRKRRRESPDLSSIEY